MDYKKNNEPPERATLSYLTTSGISLDLGAIQPAEESLLSRAYQEYSKLPGWTEFSEWWAGEARSLDIDASSVAIRVCQDLEARLGIALGKVEAPDYRDTISDLIQQRFGSRQKFCQATGIDAGHLSRVLAGKAHLSIEVVQRLAKQFDFFVTLEPLSQAERRLSPEQGMRSLLPIVSGREPEHWAP